MDCIVLLVSYTRHCIVLLVSYTRPHLVSLVNRLRRWWWFISPFDPGYHSLLHDALALLKGAHDGLDMLGPFFLSGDSFLIHTSLIRLAQKFQRLVVRLLMFVTFPMRRIVMCRRLMMLAGGFGVTAGM